MQQFLFLDNLAISEDEALVDFPVWLQDVFLHVEEDLLQVKVVAVIQINTELGIVVVDNECQTLLLVGNPR